MDKVQKNVLLLVNTVKLVLENKMELNIRLL